MTQEDKQLLLKDLCARLPHNTLVRIEDLNVCDYDNYLCEDYLAKFRVNSIIIKPYLRPMSSITEEEKKEVSILLNYEFYINDDCDLAAENDRHSISLDLMQVYIDWLNLHHFDYRGLIEKGLALEASKDMYNVK